MEEELWGVVEEQGWQGQQIQHEGANHPHTAAALCCHRALEAFEA